MGRTKLVARIAYNQRRANFQAAQKDQQHEQDLKI